MDRPHLPRSISSANLELTKNCIARTERDLCAIYPSGTINYFDITPSFTLTIPSLRQYPKEFRDYVFRRLVDKSLKEDLEYDKVINWCRDATVLTPLSTTGDGNCLLHAASLGMWGFQDRELILRKALHSAFKNCQGTSLYARWVQWRKNEMSAFGVQLEDDELLMEWEQVVDNVSEEKKGGVLQGLDQFHIFTLANVLRRPIIVYSLPKIRSATAGVTLQKITFQGIYVPLLWQPRDCKKIPLPIAFNGGHFVCLVAKDSPQQYNNGRLLLPLTEYTGTEFPVMFLLPDEKEWHVRHAFLKTTYLKSEIICAEMMLHEEPAYMKPLLSGFIDKCFTAYQYHQSIINPIQTTTNQARDERLKCKNGCNYYGNPSLNGYCSVCHKKLHSSSSSVSNSLSLRCCNAGCTKRGLPDLLGMCQQCYNLRQTSSGGSNAGKETSSGGNGGKEIVGGGNNDGKVGTQTDPVEDIQRCRNIGCEFNGTKAMLYYCSQCYKQRQYDNIKQSNISKQELVLGTEDQREQYRRDVPAHRHDDHTKCPLCQEYYSAEEYGGLCYGCYINKTKKDSAQKHNNKCKECNISTEKQLCDNCLTKDNGMPHPLPHPLRESDCTKQESIHNRNAIDTIDYEDVPCTRQPSHTSPNPLGGIQLPNPQYDLQQQRTRGYNCFLCDPNQPLALSNVICQNHAVQVRKLWLQRPTGSIAMTTDRMGVVIDSTLSDIERRNMNRVQRPVTPNERENVGGVHNERHVQQ